MDKLTHPYIYPENLLNLVMNETIHDIVAYIVINNKQVSVNYLFLLISMNFYLFLSISSP
jgi:hypothetical protein